MNMKLYYGNGVLCLPEAVLDRLADADGDTLKVLLCLAENTRASKDELASKLDITPKKVTKAIAFWQSAGLLSEGEAVKEQKQSVTQDGSNQPDVSTVQSSPLHQSTAVPHYTTEELTALLESRRELTDLIDECGRVLGKVLSTHEVSVLLSLMNYLNVDGEYLLLILAYCAGIGKKSMRYVESFAISLYDEGIGDLTALQECLKRKEQKAAAEGKIRTLFGMNSRALTAKEKKLIDTWLFTYHYDIDIITRAYEMTVDAIGKPSIPYASSILERWATANLRTLADIESADAARAAQGKETSAGNSFDTDDFFGAALQRSFGEDFTPAKASASRKKK